MTYNQEHMLLQWGGDFRETSSAPFPIDTFVGSLRFAGPGIAIADSDDVLKGLVTQLAGAWINPMMQIPSNAYLRWVKWNRIGPDGRYVSDAATREQVVAPTARGGQVGRYPLQVTCVTTWLTDLQRGRASKGRTFWPTAAEVGSGDARITLTTRDNMAQAAYSLIQSLNTVLSDAGAGMRAAVMSNVGEGKSALINGVRVGNRLDIQRRRDNATAELYSFWPNSTGSS